MCLEPGDALNLFSTFFLKGYIQYLCKIKLSVNFFIYELQGITLSDFFIYYLQGITFTVFLLKIKF